MNNLIKYLQFLILLNYSVQASEIPELPHQKPKNFLDIFFFNTSPVPGKLNLYLTAEETNKLKTTCRSIDRAINKPLLVQIWKDNKRKIEDQSEVINHYEVEIGNKNTEINRVNFQNNIHRNAPNQLFNSFQINVQKNEISNLKNKLEDLTKKITDLEDEKVKLKKEKANLIRYLFTAGSILGLIVWEKAYQKFFRAKFKVHIEKHPKFWLGSKTVQQAKPEELAKQIEETLKVIRVVPLIALIVINALMLYERS